MIRYLLYSILFHSLILMTFLLLPPKKKVELSASPKIIMDFSNIPSNLANQTTEAANPVTEAPTPSQPTTSQNNKHTPPSKKITPVKNEATNKNELNDKNLPKKNEIEEKKEPNSPVKDAKQDIKPDNTQQQEILPPVREERYNFESDPSNVSNIKGLSSFDKKAITNQVNFCYKQAIARSGVSSKEVIIIEIELQKDGKMDLSSLKIRDYYKYNDPNNINYKIAVDNVRKAIVICNQIKGLDEVKYEYWKKISFRFNVIN